MIVFPNIEKERERICLSKKELAKKLGVTRRSYYNWIGGKNPIPSDVLIKISDITGASIDYLLGKTKN
jgi:transcriptional regulator with XRE-family HTH domain